MNWRLLLVSLALCAGCLGAQAASYALIVGVSE